MNAYEVLHAIGAVCFFLGAWKTTASARLNDVKRGNKWIAIPTYVLIVGIFSVCWPAWVGYHLLKWAWNSLRD